MYGKCDTKCVICQAPLIKMSSYERGDSFYCDTPNCNFRAFIDIKSQNIDHYYFSIQIDGKNFEFFHQYILFIALVYLALQITPIKKY